MCCVTDTLENKWTFIQFECYGFELQLRHSWGRSEERELLSWRHVRHVRHVWKVRKVRKVRKVQQLREVRKVNFENY